MSLLLQAAHNYSDLGICVIAVSVDKEPVWRWRCFQNRKPRRKELERMFSHPSAAGLALICGSISAGLEAIDFDLKYDLSGQLFESYCQTIREREPELFLKLVITESRSGGRHILYRANRPLGYAQLAARPASVAEKAEGPDRTSRVLIEVISEKGYIIEAPTHGYRFTQGDPSTIPRISEEQRSFLWNAARAFNQVPQFLPRPPEARNSSADPESPIDDYNDRGDITELLKAHGWKVISRDHQRTYFLRPGDPKSKTSGDFHHQLRLFTVFTPNSPPFERLVGYRPATVFAMLEFGGDFRQAARKLLEMGYGVPYSQRKSSPGFRRKPSGL